MPRKEHKWSKRKRGEEEGVKEVFRTTSRLLRMESKTTGYGAGWKGKGHLCDVDEKHDILVKNTYLE